MRHREHQRNPHLLGGRFPYALCAIARPRTACVCSGIVNLFVEATEGWFEKGRAFTLAYIRVGIGGVDSPAVILIAA